MNRKKLLLFSLLLLFAIAVVVSYFRFPRQKSVGRLTFAPGSTAPVNSRGNPARIPLPVSGNLRLDLLDVKMPAVTITRDILKPVFIDESRVNSKNAAVAAKPPPPPPPPTPAEIARQQAARFKSLGMLKKSGVQTVFLARGEEIILVRTGDSPIHGYTVTAITDSSLYLASSAGDDRFTITLR